MAGPVTINGYTYSSSPVGRVIMEGPGLARAGVDLGYRSDLSGQAFLSGQGPNNTDAGNALLRELSTDAQLIGSIQAGLAPAPDPLDAPVDKTTTVATEQQGPTTQTTQQNENYAASGGAQDDKGTENNNQNGSNTTADKSGAQNPPQASTDGIPPGYSNGGTTPAGKSGTSQADVNSKTTPGKRLQNPLGNFSSYTYQLSLYMITPDAYAAFIDSGRKNVDSFQGQGGNGAYLIAQSGGVNNTSQKRAPFFDQDFFIDNLKITQAVNGKDTGTSTNVTGISFQIIEPYGFSFVSRLRDASTQLATTAQRSDAFKELTNPSRQFFILGIKFLGYNADGSLITPKDITGVNADPVGNASGIYARYFDIMITEMKFKLEGKAVVYSIQAVSTPVNEGLTLKRGIMWNGAELTADTVATALTGDDEMTLGILTKLNKDQESLVGKTITRATKYSVVYLGEARQTIANASIVSPADVDKFKYPMSQVTDTDQVNEKTSQESTPDPTLTRIKFDNGTPILQAIEQIIKQSSYMTDALKAIPTTSEESNPDTGEDDEKIPKSKKTIKWFNIGVETKALEYDPKQEDFVYDIKYIIQPYETPVITSTYANSPTPYYGPFKRYDYWFTGKNTNIIKYEQTLDNAFFNVTLGEASDDSSSGGNANIPNIPNIPQPQPRQGLFNKGSEGINSYTNSLFDPGNYAHAKIQILGDPDFLMPTNPCSEESVYNKYYGTDGFTINPNGGQVFIEINFKEPLDYNNNTGVQQINDKIKFWNYPKHIQKDIDSRGGGISYMVITVISSFSGGKFVQDIDAVINTFGNDSNSDSSDAALGRQNDTSESTGSDRAGEGTSESSNGQGSSITTVGFSKPDIASLTNTSGVGPENPLGINLPTGQITITNPLTGQQIANGDGEKVTVTAGAANANEWGGRDPLDF